MKKTMRKWTFFAALTGPVMFASMCTSGLREALIEGGFKFVEEAAVHTLEAFVPIDELLGAGEEHE